MRIRFPTVGHKKPPGEADLRGSQSNTFCLVHQFEHSLGDGSHLKLEVEDRNGIARSGIGFGLGERDPGRGATIDAAFAPMINEWQGRTRVELEIRQLLPD